MKTLTPLLAQLASAAVIWDGRFNDFSSSTDLNKWSWVSHFLVTIIAKAK